MTSNLKPKEAKLEILPDRSYKQHKSSPSTSIYSNCALEHINYFSFNHQILIKEITISNSFHSPLINFRCNSGAVPIITPYSDELLEFTVDPESNLPNTDALILKLNSDLDLQFRFYFDKDTIGVSGQEDEDWYLIHCNNSIELSSILQKINNDTNFIIKNKNIYPIELDFKRASQSSHSSLSEAIQWSWRWENLSNVESCNGGYKNICAFVKRSSESFHLIAEFNFWLNVHTFRARKSSISSNNLHLRKGSLASIPNLSRAPSKQNLEDILPSTLISDEKRFSNESKISKISQESEDKFNNNNNEIEEDNEVNENEIINPLMDINLSDRLVYTDDDGPVFRATLQQLEKRVTSFKHDIKKIIKLGQELIESKKETYEVEQEFYDVILNLPSITPLSRSYLYEAALLIKSNEENYLYNLTTYITDPLKRIYDNEIKLAESKKKTFDQESDEFYSYLSKYLSATKDKSRKSNFSDAKYQQRQKQFELARFNYYTYIHELRGGCKDQEILHYFTSFADKVSNNYSILIEGLDLLKPKLNQLLTQIEEVNKEILLKRKDKDEKRRLIIKSDSNLSEMMFVNSINEATTAKNGYNPSKVIKTSIDLKNNKFHGIRDLQSSNREATVAIGRKREGFLFTQTKPLKSTGGSKFDKNLPGQNSWHKKWCVLSGGYLHEYNNWKKQLEVNFEPVPLQFATVRVANQASRKFCFEIVTPKFRRQYQATSEDDMASWIAVITNSIESIWNGTSSCDDLKGNQNMKFNSKFNSNLDSMKFNKGEKFHSPLSMEILSPNNFLDQQYLIDVLKKDQSNLICADCDSNNPEWCSINFGILLCIECSGIHRSLGTHITKIRSLTLDVVTFTPDLITLLEKIGNGLSNEYWEYLLDENKLFVDEMTGTKWVKPTSSDERTFKLRYITAKYVDHMFLKPDIPCNSLKLDMVNEFSMELVDIPESKKLITASIFTAVYLELPMPILQSIILGGIIDALFYINTNSSLVKLFGVNNYITPLHLALFLHTEDENENDSKYPLYYIAELLIQNGANVNIKLPNTQYSLLHFASIHNNLSVIQYLLLKGANPIYPLDNSELWPCFLSSDFACQQILFDVTYNEAVKMNFDEKILIKLAPVLPPRVKSDDEDMDLEPSLSPPSLHPQEHNTAKLPEIGKLSNSTTTAVDTITEDNPSEMIRSISSDNRSPSGPIKRLSGGWKQQLQNFKSSNKEREVFMPTHGHSHSMTITSSSPVIPFSNSKKNMFRRSGNPFLSQDLNYLASSAPSNSHTLPKNLPSPLEHRTASFGSSQSSSDTINRQHNNTSYLKAMDDLSLNSSHTQLTNNNNNNQNNINYNNNNYNPNIINNSKLHNPFMVNNEQEKSNDKKSKIVRATSIIDAFRKLSK